MPDLTPPRLSESTVALPATSRAGGFADPPPAAAWRHENARVGFEVAWFHPLDQFDPSDGGWNLRGHATGLEDGQTWSVAYDIDLDAAWRTRRARVVEDSARGEAVTVLEADGGGSWRVDGRPVPELEGCLDVDLEASAMTNTLPVHRLPLLPAARADVPAAYVRLGLAVQRLDQTYRCRDDPGPPFLVDYAAPAFDFTCELRFDASGLVLEYPGIAVRAF
jgi:hypothetical protein